MQATHAHARRTLHELARRRRADRTIGSLSAVDLLESLGYVPSHYGKTYGQVVSLIDVACVLQGLPLIGRLIKFQRADDEIGEEWSLWRPHMVELDAATLARQWSADDFDRLSNGLPKVCAKNWWKKHASDSESLLQEALVVARR